jgi:hypothetical protein
MFLLFDVKIDVEEKKEHAQTPPYLSLMALFPNFPSCVFLDNR